MAQLLDVVKYYKNYRALAVVSIAASSVVELLDLVVPYAIGQLLNVVSQAPVDSGVQSVVNQLGLWWGISDARSLTLAVLLGAIFMVTVVRAPVEPWLGVWFHWAIALRSRRDHGEQVIRKLLSLPLGFYDDHYPGRIA